MKLAVMLLFYLAATAPAEPVRYPGIMLERPTIEDCQWLESEVPGVEAKYGPESGNAHLVRTNARLCRRDVAIEDLATKLTAKLRPHELGELFTASHETWRKQRAAHCAWSRAASTGSNRWPDVEERYCQLQFSELWEARLHAFDACISGVKITDNEGVYAPASAYDVAACANHLDLLPADAIE